MNHRTKVAISIDDSILSILEKSDHPLSTREISLKIKKAWHTVNSHCMRLQIDGKLECFRTGNNTLWSVKYEK